ncbi:hypothetical protein EV401DRAFT_1275006, partial [Pisolithus croceorrhizus]
MSLLHFRKRRSARSFSMLRTLSWTSQVHIRNEPSMTKLPTLSSYLYAMQSLLAFILRIPPVDSSTPLHTTFLLRLVPVILIL